MNIVVGTEHNQVYFYDHCGVVGQIGLDELLSSK